MLNLNQEYTYKAICQELGWKESSGNQKKKQIREIEASYEFYHPENKKTHKLKKSYIFTKQLKEPELKDKRVTNGGVKKVPDSVFDYLFKCILVTGARLNGYYQRGKMNNIYISTSLIYKEFGLDIYNILHRIFAHSDYEKVKRLFQDMCIDTVRSQTITRICRLLKYPTNSLPKGILRAEGSGIIPEDDLLIEYNIYMEWFLDFFKCKTEHAAIIYGKYFDVTEAIKNEFATRASDKKYDVTKLNKITVASDYFKDFEPDDTQKNIMQEAFRRTILNTILAGIQRRCFSEKHYKEELSWDEKDQLIECFIMLYERSECLDKNIFERAEILRKQVLVQIEQESMNKVDAAPGVLTTLNETPI